MYVPESMFFTKGVGVDKNKLTSFEMALRDAGIERYNLVGVSSIYPPGCKIVQKRDGIKHLESGQIVHCVKAEASTNEPHRLIAASVGLAVPKDRKIYGYLSEHHSHGENERKAGDYTEDLAATMLATTLGIEFDVETAWEERETAYKAGGQIITTRNCTQTAVGNKKGYWTTVVAVGVFVPPEDKLKPYLDEIISRGIEPEELGRLLDEFRRR